MVNNAGLLVSLESKVNNSDIAVRREAAEDLVFAEDSNAIDLLQRLLLDENKAVREAAGDALLRRGNQEGAEQLVKNFINPRIEIRNHAMLLLVCMGEPALEFVFPALENEDHDVRKFAADVIGEVGSEIGILPLVKTIADVDANVGLSAVEALGKIGGDIAFDELEIAFDKYPNIKSTIAEALGKLNNPNGIRIIKNSLSDEDPLVVFAVTEAFGEIGGIDEIVLLEQFIEESEGYIKSIAITSLVKLTNKTNKELQINLFSALHVDEFVAAAEGNKEVFDYAVRMVARLTAIGDINALLKSYPNLNNELKTVVLETIKNEKNAQTLSTTYSALLEPSPQVKIAAIRNLAYWQDKKSVSSLLNLLGDEDEWVVYRAAEAIGMIGEKNSAEQLLNKLNIDKPLRQIAIIKALDVLEAKIELMGLLNSDLIHDEGVRQVLNEITGNYSSE